MKIVVTHSIRVFFYYYYFYCWKACHCSLSFSVFMPLVVHTLLHLSLCWWADGLYHHFYIEQLVLQWSHCLVYWEPESCCCILRLLTKNTGYSYLPFTIVGLDAVPSWINLCIPEVGEVLSLGSHQILITSSTAHAMFCTSGFTWGYNLALIHRWKGWKVHMCKDAQTGNVGHECLSLSP